MRLTIGLLIALLMSCFNGARAQRDSLVDVFPLAIGNQWTYRYYTLFEQNGTGGILTITDSGWAEYSIVGKVSTTDSTRWVFHVRRNLIHHRSIPNSTYPIQDSFAFELIERHDGQHHVYRLEDPNLIRLDVFPFTKEFTDTTRVYRYRTIGPGDTIMFKSAIPRGFPSLFFRSTFTFKRSIGLARLQFHNGVVDATYSAEHFLIRSLLTSADPRLEPAKPEGFSLFQNYPNPFNPTTRIEYSIPKTSHVSLKVFDLLGREVATLVDEVQGLGFKSVEFDASRLSSGVYFYRVQVEGFVLTKKLTIIR